MGKLIPLIQGRHSATQALLPWYLTGRLDSVETARVEAHIAECPDCSADISTERRLMVEWAALPMDADHSWIRLREKLLGEPPVADARRTLTTRYNSLRRTIDGALRSAPAGLGWALAAVQALALILIGFATINAYQTARYHVLGASAPSPAGNAIIMFRPDTTERTLRGVLITNNARVVGGPTAAGAWIIRVPRGNRAAALAALSARPDISLAQPIDESGSN